MATKSAPIPMRMKVRAGERGSMEYDGSIAQGIELAFYYVTPKRRGELLATLQETHEKLKADEAVKDAGVSASSGDTPEGGA